MRSSVCLLVRRARALVWGVGSVLLGLLASTASALAHSGATLGFATIDVEAEAVHYRLTLSPASLPADVATTLGLVAPGTVVPANLEPLRAAVRDKVRVSSDSMPCPVGDVDAAVPRADRPDVVLSATFKCSGEIRTFAVRDDLSEVLGPTYHTLAHITVDGHSQQFSFGSDARETTVAVGVASAAARGAGSFFPLGIEHILTGYDHLLFLIALILRGGNLVQLLKIITAFTVAHSITLGLAALDVVTLPGVFVESVIALSIAYVAMENMLPRFAISRRWTVSFLFGLVHGFGFSSVLREIGLPKENLVLALLNFNLGVEAGQAAVALVLVPVLLRLRRYDWEPRAMTTVSSAILVVGLWLFVDRAFLGG